jgi:predicted TIM-barrel fold metal-dependent hydrolase
VWRKRDRAPADSSGLADPSVHWSFDALEDVDFRAAGYGRFEWTVDGEDYVKQYIPPSVADMSYPAESLVAEMDYAGVDMALLHRTPYLGIGNEFVAGCVRRFPDRLQGLAHVEEWLIQTKPDESISKLEQAVNELGLMGLQFLPDQIPLYGQPADWDGPGLRPFWDAVAALNIPVFFTPGYTSLASPGGDPLEAVLQGLRAISTWMERYPEVTVVLTHGFSWRMFAERDILAVPDEVYRAAPIDNPNFHVQVLFAIFLGGMWDYPMPQVRPVMEQLVRHMGPNRIIWGTDIPMVLRFYTYRQNLDHIRRNCDFLASSEVDMIVGGNMARLLGQGIEGSSAAS